MADNEHNKEDWQEALRRIDAAREKGGREVNLSHLVISTLPQALFDLAETLEVLDLNRTQITDAEPLKALTNLTAL